MDFKEFVNKKKELEANLQAEISNMVESFRRDTGMSPSQVDVQMIESLYLGDPVKQHIVGEVAVRFEI